MTEIREDVLALREAAGRRDWDGCRHATAALLRRLPPDEGMAVGVELVSPRLLAFERHHPEARWPLAWFDRIAGHTAGALPVEAPPELGVEDCSGPGGNNVLNAVEALWEASRSMEEPARCAAKLTDAIAEAIMAGMVERWGDRDPARWARWYAAVSAGGEPEQPGYLLEMMNDPEIVELDRQGWEAVAGAISRQIAG